MVPPPSLAQTIDTLYALLLARRSADPASSYTAKLFASGLDVILKKVGEEATETVIAAKNGDPARLTSELADLWYHLLVLMAQQGVSPDLLAAELARRSGRSGLEEKASRTPGS